MWTKLEVLFACASERGCEIGIFAVGAKVYWAGTWLGRVGEEIVKESILGGWGVAE